MSPEQLKPHEHDGSRRRKGEQRFPARRRLRYVPIEKRNSSKDQSSEVVRATRRLKGLDHLDEDELRQIQPLKGPDIFRQIARMDSRLQHLLDLLGNGPVEDTPSDSPSYKTMLLPDDPELSGLCERAHSYYEEWSSLILDQQENTQSLFHDFASSSYVDMLVKQHALPFLLLSQELEVLRVCHKDLYELPVVLPLKGDRIQLPEHSEDGWVQLPPGMPAFHFQLDGGSILMPRKQTKD